jgi:acetylornithine deacetylase
LGVAKANLIARPAATSHSVKIGLAFVCHTDTVPYSETWPEALQVEQRDEKLHGCGTCDVKGALACFLSAISTIDSPRDDIALILTADEEIGCKGVERLLSQTSLRIRSAIISEPTSLQPGVAGKGYGVARITVEGREAHSAFPAQGVSAISIASRLIGQIEDTFASASGQITANALFDPPRTTFNIGVIEGGTAKNIIPGRCSFLFEWRAIPDEDPAHVLQQLRTLVERAQIAYPESRVALEQMRNEPGFQPHASGTLQQALACLLSSEPIGISFGSEASRIARIAEEVIVIGPGDMRTAHSNRECVPIAELESWTDVLRVLFTRK